MESSIVVAETIEHPPIKDENGNLKKAKKSIGHYFIGMNTMQKLNIYRKIHWRGDIW